MPRAGWEGWFLITIGAARDPVRWTKTHLFRCSGRRGRHPLAAVEGLEAAGEIVTFVGTKERVLRFERKFTPGELSTESALALDGALDWRLGEPMRFLRSHEAHRIELEVLNPASSERIAWIRVPGIISYITRFATARGEIQLDTGPAIEHHGLAVFEHAYGTEVHFAPRKHLVRGPWHWDVLALPNNGAAGALAVTLPGLGMVGVRAAGNLGDRFRALRRPKIKRDPDRARARARPREREREPARFDHDHDHDHVHGYEHEHEHDQADVHWRGLLREPGGPSLEYHAVASTPIVTAGPGVFFVGFDYSGELRTAGRSTPISGTGFAEFGQPE
jgi:hypothetical protein